jgi:glycosyltransferase involved in cell wall biosynthesis
MNTSKTIILITRGFPFGKGETFLETEINILSKHFGKIVIFAQNDNIYSGFDRSVQRILPPNVLVHKLPDYKKPSIFKLIKYLKFIKYLIAEFRIILKRKITNTTVLKTFIQYYLKAYENYNYIIKNISFSSNEKLFFYSYWSYDTPLCALMLQSTFGGVSFSRTHGGDIYEELHPHAYLPFRKIYLKKLNCIFTISDIGNYYLAKKTISLNNITTSKLGTLPAENIPTYEHGELKIISIGALYYIKRIDLLIEALSILDNNIQINWIHFGTGPDEIKIHELAKLKLIKENIKYAFKGFVNNNELRNYLSNHAFDVCINTSSSEGIAVSIMETMSYGIPCIATDVGGTTEIVTNKNGILLSENPSPQDISSAILKFYNKSEQEILEMRSEALNTWDNLYNANKNYKLFAQQISDLYCL